MSTRLLARGFKEKSWQGHMHQLAKHLYVYGVGLTHVIWHQHIKEVPSKGWLDAKFLDSISEATLNKS